MLTTKKTFDPNAKAKDRERQQTDERARMDKIVENSSEKNRNFFIAYLGLLIYVQAIIFSTTDLQLLVSTGGLKLPLIDLNVPLVGFYVVVPIFVIALHFNFLQNLESHHYKLMRWQELHSGGVVPRNYIYPFLFDYATLEEGSQFQRLLKFANNLLVNNLVPITICLLLIRFSDRQDAIITLWHYLCFVFDSFLVWKFRSALQKNSQPEPIANTKVNKLIKSWGFCRDSFCTGMHGIFSLLIMMETLLTLVLATTTSHFFVDNIQPWIQPIAFIDKTVTIVEKDWQDEATKGAFRPIETLILHVLMMVSRPAEWVLPRIAINPNETVWQPNSKTLIGEAELAGQKDWVKYFNLQGKGFRPANANLRFIKLPHQNLPNAQLYGAELQGADLENVQLQGANLEYAQLQGAELNYAKLQKVNLSSAVLNEANLRHAQLQGAILVKSQLQGANLANTQLQKAVLVRAHLQKAKLNYARLQEANLSSAILIEADLSSAELQGANLVKAQLQAAKLNFSKLQRANLSSTVLNESILKSAQLQGTKLENAQLKKTKLIAAQLQGAKLTNAQLQGADLSSANLQGADLSSANLEVADLSSTNLQGANLFETRLQGANLFETQLQGADLDSATLNGAILTFSDLNNSFNIPVASVFGKAGPESLFADRDIDWGGIRQQADNIHDSKVKEEYLERIKQAMEQKSSYASLRIKYKPTDIARSLATQICNPYEILTSTEIRKEGIQAFRHQYFTNYIWNYENIEQNQEYQALLTDIDRKFCTIEQCADIRDDIDGLDCQPYLRE